MEVNSFNGKLNKVDGNVYVIEETVTLSGGVYEAELRHDNINDATFSVYTGPKLTGEKLDAYVLSTPSLAPWKRIVRVYADVDTVYLSYETAGDTVEAEDVNELQTAVINTQIALNTEVDRAKNAEQTLTADLQAEVTRAKAAEKSNRDAIAAEATRATDVETDLKTNIDDNMKVVNTELGNRYTKDKVYTKEEVQTQLKEIIGSAPEALDTLKEIAEALGNDPNFAGTVTKELAKKVDKVDGKSLTSNDYSDAEKAIVADVNTKKHTHGNKSVLDGITQTLINKWNEAATGIETGNFLYRDELVSDTNTNSAELPAAAAAVYENAQKLAELRDEITLTASVTGTGSVSIPDAADAPKKNVKLYGKSEQNTTKGLQLFNYQNRPGVTHTDFKITDNGNGSYSAVGTPTGNVDFYLFGKWGSEIIVVPGDVSFYCNGLSNTSNLVLVNNTASTFVSGDQICKRSIATAAFVRFLPDVTYNTIFYPMVYNTLSDGGKPEWEPYTGGVSSPNMQYPQGIKNVNDLLIVSSIGGRNYLKQSSFRDKESFDNLSVHYPALSSKELSEGEYTTFIKNEVSTSRLFFSRTITNMWDAFDVGDEITMSAQVYIESYNQDNPTVSQKTTLHIRTYNSDRSQLVDMMKIFIDESIPTGQWVTVSATSTMTDLVKEYALQTAPVFYIALGLGTYRIRVRDVHVGAGHDVTPWSPAIEDINTENAKSYQQCISIIDLTGYTLRGLGSRRDTISQHNDVWGAEMPMIHVLGKDLKWDKLYAANEFSDSFCAKTVEIFNAPDYPSIISNSFSYVGNRILDKNIDGVYLFSGTLRCRVVGATTLAEFITAIANVDFAFPLTVPTWEPFPEEIQKQFNDFRTYEGAHSTMYVVSDVLPDIELEYFRNVGIIKALFPTVLQDVQSPKGIFTWDDLKGV